MLRFLWREARLAFTEAARLRPLVNRSRRPEPPPFAPRTVPKRSIVAPRGGARRFPLAILCVVTSGWLCANAVTARAQLQAGARPAGKASAAVVTDQPPLAQIERGRELFVRQWTPGDSHAAGGDGLGPMFNARSCADCHNQGGAGGGGDLSHNVDLLAIIPPANKARLDRGKFAERVAGIHPGFTGGAGGTTVRPSITLHKFGTNPAYGEFRAELVSMVSAPPTYESPDPSSDLKPVSSHGKRPAANKAVLRKVIVQTAQTEPPPKHIEFKLVARNVPALFGAHLIDSIPDELIQQAAKEEAQRHNGIKGQVALSSDGKVGKFGWRGQTATLKQFVLGACANELGLQVPGNDQALDPLDPTHRSPGVDMTDAQCDDLVAYVASLPPPAQTRAKSQQKEHVLAGAYMFNQAGCAGCHMRNLGGVEGIYSDLLLHDMGLNLADPVGANPRTSSDGTPTSFGAYYGGSIDVFVDVPPETRRQWRTPPLWGVAISAPYLHDGRAPTLQDAILAHGGEAVNARRAFELSTSRERQNLLAFLESLTAPEPGQ